MSIWSALRAVFKIARRKARSSLSGKLGSPQGWGTFRPVTMRLAPTCLPNDAIAVIKAKGIPSFSISLASTAPLRVSVPQVDTSKTASTPSAFKSLAMALPIAWKAVTVAMQPLAE